MPWAVGAEPLPSHKESQCATSVQSSTVTPKACSSWSISLRVGSAGGGEDGSASDAGDDVDDDIGAGNRRVALVLHLVAVLPLK